MKKNKILIAEKREKREKRGKIWEQVFTEAICCQ